MGLPLAVVPKLFPSSLHSRAYLQLHHIELYDSYVKGARMSILNSAVFKLLRESLKSASRWMNMDSHHRCIQGI